MELRSVCAGANTHVDVRGENSSGVSVPWYRMLATVLMWKHLLTSVLKWHYEYFCQAATCCQRSHRCFMQALSLESSFVVFSQHNEIAESHTGCQNFSAVLFLMSLRFNCIYFLLRVNQGAGVYRPSTCCACFQTVGGNQTWGTQEGDHANTPDRKPESLDLNPDLLLHLICLQTENQPSAISQRTSLIPSSARPGGGIIHLHPH